MAIFGSRHFGKGAVNWACIRFALSLIGIACVLIATDAAAKFAVSSRFLVVWHATRANPARIFYLDFNDTTQQGDLLGLAEPVRGSANF